MRITRRRHESKIQGAKQGSRGAVAEGGVSLQARLSISERVRREWCTCSLSGFSTRRARFRSPLLSNANRPRLETDKERAAPNRTSVHISSASSEAWANHGVAFKAALAMKGALFLAASGLVISSEDRATPRRESRFGSRTYAIPRGRDDRAREVRADMNASERKEHGALGQHFAYVPDGGTKAYDGKEDRIDALQAGILSRKIVRFSYKDSRSRARSGDRAPFVILMHRQACTSSAPVWARAMLRPIYTTGAEASASSRSSASSRPSTCASARSRSLPISRSTTCSTALRRPRRRSYERTARRRRVLGREG
ncbi:MAG: hypothetical protein JWO36_3127 [Myxococcales bacterium]|nr:hypothetical protein [Myxococcales bacterium]